MLNFFLGIFVASVIFKMQQRFRRHTSRLSDRPNNVIRMDVEALRSKRLQRVR